MKILKPKPVEINTISLAASAYAEWSQAGVSYSVGDNVKVTLTYAWEDRAEYNYPSGYETEYECLVAHTSTADNGPEDDASNWLKLGASNKYRMFDDYVNTRSVAPSGSNLTFSFRAKGYLDTLALFEMRGSSVTIHAYTSTTGALIYSETADLWGDRYPIHDGYSYCFSGFEQAMDRVFEVNFLYYNLTYYVTITPSSTQAAACGHVIVGLFDELGKTEYSPSIGIDDYSTKSTNDFGETYLNQRAYAKTASASIKIDSSDVAKTADILAAARSTPCLYQLNNEGTEYEPLLIYGFYRDFTVVLENYNKSTLNIELEGMI